MYWCEGYATALSLRACLKALKLRYIIRCTFSVGNMRKMATDFGEGIIIADNDASHAGEDAAIATDLPYWISDYVGEDFNDQHKRLGTFRLSQDLGKFLRSL